MKCCSRCGETKLLDAFSKQKQCRLGVHSMCKQCCALARRLERAAKPKRPLMTAEQRRATARRAEARYAAKPEYRARRAEQARNRRKMADGALRNRIGPALRRCLKRGKGGHSTTEIVGYRIADLRLWLEAKFQPGMSWDNMAKWHIDHIRPLASFDHSDPEQVRLAWALTNLQPLWAAENMRKGARWAGVP